MMSVALGLRAAKGGAVVVAVFNRNSEPNLGISAFLPTSSSGDRLSLEPYHVAHEFAREPHGGISREAKAAVDEGRRCQQHLATSGLQAIVAMLADRGCEPVSAALLVNRATWVTDILEYSASWREHLPVAEGLAVREALRFAIAACGLAINEVDEKSLPESAAATLGMTPEEIEAHLKRLGTAAGKPWRKEQKLACLCAWSSLTATRSQPAS